MTYIMNDICRDNNLFEIFIYSFIGNKSKCPTSKNVYLLVLGKRVMKYNLALGTDLNIKCSILQNNTTGADLITECRRHPPALPILVNDWEELDIGG